MAEPAPQYERESSQPTWSRDAAHVKKALAWLKRRRTVTADALVEWDRQHGQRLFQWNDQEAAEEHRRQQARIFLNVFRQLKDGLRMRAFINFHEDEEAGIEQREYYRVDVIIKNERLRQIVIDDLMRRIEKAAAELKFWKLSEQEREGLVNQFLAALG